MIQRLFFAAVLLPVGALVLSACGGGEGRHHDRHARNVISVDESVAQGRWKGYGTHVPRGVHEFAVELHRLSGDADLYVESPRGGAACESFRGGRASELCVFVDPVPGEWRIEVAGWDRGRTQYTLTVSLWPRQREASLWPAGQGVAVATAADASAAVGERATASVADLDILPALVAVASRLSAGEAVYRIELDGEQHGRVRVTVLDDGPTRAFHFKAVLRDPETGVRRLLQSRAGHPVRSGMAGGAPESGQLIRRSGGQEAEIRLGFDTGTGAEVQVVAEPGPVVRERHWRELPSTGYTLERD